MATSQQSVTGYGPSTTSRYHNLHFNGDERKYEMWETRFLGYMLMKGLKDTIDPKLNSDGEYDAAEPAQNEKAYAELIQWLDEKSLSLVIRDARDDGREALKTLRAHYRGKGKQRVIRLYTELTSLVMKPRETVTDYILRAENAATGLREAGEDISDGLLVAMLLKGLPPHFKSFVAVVTQSDKNWSFKDLKSSLRDYEDTEKARADGGDSSVMKFNLKGGKSKGKNGRDMSNVTCHACGEKGHISPRCPNKNKKKKNQQNSFQPNVTAKQAASEEYHTFHFVTATSDSEECASVSGASVSGVASAVASMSDTQYLLDGDDL